ncbi:hypothetical protein F5Y04DRAFT_249554 [Hypomontagnella monticulosa]|nr:hypothetical protein F5Y04DRAFT_249554 [Hypomontagnella monticulosa]
MAPSGPRKGSGPSGPRNNRSASTNGTKPAGRGGVAKRRSNAARIDKDGDLDMDAPIATNRASRKSKRVDHSIPTAPRSTRPATNGSRGPRPTRQAHQIIQRVIGGAGGSLSSRIENGISGGTKAFKAQSNNNMTIRVEGLKSSKAANNEGGGLKELLTFLERKAQSVGKITRQVRIKKSHINGDYVYITTSKADGAEILKLNNFGFAGTHLAITEASGTPPPSEQKGMSSTALEVKDQLRETLRRRYDVDSKLLDLSALGEDTILGQMGFFSGESKPEKLFRALMAVCDGLFKTAQEKRDAVHSISLAGNNIDDVAQIMSLTDTFPDLVNLDLRKNQFKDLNALQKWRHRLRSLQVLLLQDNPIEVANPNYGTDMTTWFPKLQNLSGVQVRTPEQIASMGTPEPVEQPKLEQPSMQQPSMQQPSLQQPGLQQPNWQQPSLQQPSLQQPSLQQPNLQQPNLQQPSMQQPNLEQQVNPQQQQVNLEAQQEQMLIELCNRTGMIPDYSKACLDGANWDFDQAINLFNEKRAQLPAEAFAAMPLGQM